MACLYPARALAQEMLSLPEATTIQALLLPTHRKARPPPAARRPHAGQGLPAYLNGGGAETSKGTETQCSIGPKRVKEPRHNVSCCQPTTRKTGWTPRCAHHAPHCA